MFFQQVERLEAVESSASPSTGRKSHLVRILLFFVENAGFHEEEKHGFFTITSQDCFLWGGDDPSFTEALQVIVSLFRNLFLETAKHFLVKSLTQASNVSRRWRDCQGFSLWPHSKVVFIIPPFHNVELNSGSRLWVFWQQVAFRLTSLKRGRSATWLWEPCIQL